MSQFQSDWSGFFDQAPGTVVDLGSGAKVTLMHDGSAVYQDSTGAWVQYTKSSNPADVARKAPALQKQWNDVYVTQTNAPKGAQTRTDPAASGFRINADGTVTRIGMNPDAAAQTMGGDYTHTMSINSVQDPEARAYYQANPDEFYAALTLGLDPNKFYRDYFYNTGGNRAGMASAEPRPGAVAGSGTGGATGSTGGGGFGGDLSLTQQSLLKALMDQQERDSITGEMRGNANELYDRAQGYEWDALRDIALYTGGNSGIYNRYQPDIENDVATAVADARTGQTQALNTAARQAARYGINMPVSLAGVSTAQAAQLASAANSTRNDAINNYRNLVGQGIGMKEGAFRTSHAATADAMGRAEAASMGNRNMRIQDESLDWAKQLDVTGMARGMPGASQGAYGVAVGAGNSAVQNQMAPGQALIGAMGQANNTTMQGRQLAMQGTMGVLNAQTSYANAVGQSGDSFGSLLGGVGGLVGGLSKAGVFSDRRLKENIELVGRDDRTGLNLYEFGYIDDPDMRRYVGVMADEVIAVDPYAVEFDERGFAMVNYARLGIELKEVV